MNSVVKKMAMLWFFSSISVYSYAGTNVAACNVEKIKSNILSHLESIRDYQFVTEVLFDGTFANSQVKGKRPNQLYIQLSIQPPSKPLIITTIYDGVYQWVESKSSSMTHVMKIQLAKLTSPQRPFDSSYNVMGTGLLNGEGYPDTISVLLTTYNLQAQCANETISLSGHINIDAFKKYAKTVKFLTSKPGSVERFARLFGFITLNFDSNDYTVRDYSFGADSNTVKFHVKFSSFQINQGLDDTVFRYSPPSGVVVTDITNDLLMQNSQAIN
ncbi:MAG: hypothetical protein L3K25_06410 [Gammaproteobacteria bacterium]|nr:hypothetical protein [Gammaproteobacteria bacterium]MCF6338696.1 hypothetical protein [Gammaproteobacteria bacterium]